jgi:alkanesulfonate monooxygenase SsuD/methylene tetrahydromethanopterin reductase-like flavin-dependent oxidoreductase (luciferase family)
MLGFNAFAADSDEEARAARHLGPAGLRQPAHRQSGKLPPPVAGYAETLPPRRGRCSTRRSPARRSATPDTVKAAIEAFVERTGADELMITSQIYDHQARLRSYEIAAEAMA